MNFFVSSGIVSYQLNIGLMAWILGLLYKRNLWREKPLFSAFVITRLARSLILFPVLLAYGLDTYSRIYWLTDGIVLAIELLAVVELWDARIKWSIGGAVGLFLGQTILAIQKDDFAMTVEFIVAALVVCFTVPLIYRNTMALGFFATSLVTALTMTNGFLFKAETARYLPTYVFLFANALWVVAAFRLRRDAIS